MLRLFLIFYIAGVSINLLFLIEKIYPSFKSINPILAGTILSSALFQATHLFRYLSMWISFPRYTLDDFSKLPTLPASALAYLNQSLSQKTQYKSKFSDLFSNLKRDLDLLNLLVRYYGPTHLKCPFKTIPLQIPSKSGVPEWRLKIGK